jgi:hypothetical protein
LPAATRSCGETAATTASRPSASSTVLIHNGNGNVRADGGDGFNDCHGNGGDEVVTCPY